MSAEEAERDRRVRQVRRRAWLFIAAGLTLLAGGGAAVLLLGQPVQRIVLGAVAVPLYVVLGIRAVRQAVRERLRRRAAAIAGGSSLRAAAHPRGVPVQLGGSVRRD